MPLKIGDIEVLHVPITAPEAADSFYNGFEPSVQTLPKGHRRFERSRPFSVETVYERDVEIPMRDGVVLRADVFRPADEREKVPAILPWSPYGKSGTGSARLEMIPAHIGIPFDWLSDYEKFEAPDPADWTARGYAVVNVDARGSWDSQGDLRWFGTPEGKDGYDAVEYIAKLPWCNGSVCMAGNSWLGVGQWFTAAEQPPSLKCIAPFEGASDMYREMLCRGGIPFTSFLDWVASTLRGRQQQEHLAGMLKKYPLMNEYWADKRARADKIKVPAYVVASYSTCLHTVGTLRAFEDIPHDKKWLRIHDTQEWYDLYQPKTNDELQRFFDRYTKGVENGWEESTPPVRVSLLGFNEPNIINHVVSNWPVKETAHKTLYLSPNAKLTSNPVAQSSKLSYQSDAPAMQEDADTEELLFKHTFTSRTHLLGAAKATLYVSCADFHDMDVFVQLRKADKNGNILISYNVPLADLQKMGMDEKDIPKVNPMIYLGPTGQLRASHRALEENLSTAHWSAHAHDKEDFITPGEVVKLEIGMWPSGMVFSEGESIVLKVSGHWMTLSEYPWLRGEHKPRNKGKHVVHFGGNYDSHVVLPLVEIGSPEETRSIR